jgi:hypothetical protein
MTMQDDQKEKEMIMLWQDRYFQMNEHLTDEFIRMNFLQSKINLHDPNIIEVRELLKFLNMMKKRMQVHMQLNMGNTEWEPNRKIRLWMNRYFEMGNYLTTEFSRLNEWQRKLKLEDPDIMELRKLFELLDFMQRRMKICMNY